jgi:hypothetical protein
MPHASRIQQQGFVAWLAAAPLLLIALFGLYTWFVLSWSYSEGDRAGYIQKFSKKGWICKTWEGELAMVTMPGTLTEKFYFTVTDDAVAKTLNQHLGKKVTLTYDEHIGIPSNCFGDTGYFVTGVKDIE